MAPDPSPLMLKLLRAVERCRPHFSPWRGVVFRSCSPEYANSADLTSGEGSRRYGGRWNAPGSFPAVYASLDAETAMAEALAQARYYGVAEESLMPRVFVALEVEVDLLLDLRRPEVRRELRVSADRMVLDDWRRATPTQPSVTQSLGWAVHEIGLEGVLAPAAARAGWTNIVVLPDRLRSGSVLRARGV